MKGTSVLHVTAGEAHICIIKFVKAELCVAGSVSESWWRPAHSQQSLLPGLQKHTVGLLLCTTIQTELTGCYIISGILHCIVHTDHWDSKWKISIVMSSKRLLWKCLKSEKCFIFLFDLFPSFPLTLVIHFSFICPLSQLDSAERTCLLTLLFFIIKTNQK